MLIFADLWTKNDFFKIIPKKILLLEKLIFANLWTKNYFFKMNSKKRALLRNFDVDIFGYMGKNNFSRNYDIFGYIFSKQSQKSLIFLEMLIFT